MRQETMAFIGQIKSARLPLEQFDPRQCFEFTHRLGNHRGRDSEHGGCSADLAAFGDSDEIANLPERHQSHEAFWPQVSVLFSVLRFVLPRHAAILCTYAHRLISTRL